MADLQTIQELVRQAEQTDKEGHTTSSRYVTSSLREDVDRTEAYLNSKHISGEVDHMGREKPFFNIVNSAVMIWYRATDIDRKNIVIRADNNETVIPALLASIKLQDWMKKSGFGQFLNDWGLTLAKHGSAITKFIEVDGELHCQVMDWNNIIVDAVDFDNNLKIEKHWFTPAQLRKKKGYNQKLVKQLLENTTTRKTQDGQQKDNKSGYIPIYEVHGELSKAIYKQSKGEVVEEDDYDEYFQQMHIITFQETNNGEYEDYTLFSGKESRDPYMITHLIKKDGQTYSGGAVKNLFEAQWMVNHSEKQIKDYLDFCSKYITQTSDATFQGQNILTSIDNGDILIHKPNEPLTRINNQADINPMQSVKSSWQSVAAQINGISEAMMGEAPKAGAAWRQVQATLQESHSLFELMAENKGLAVEDMMTNYVIPFFKKQLDDTEEISSILEAHQIKQIDSKYLPNEVTRRVNEKKKRTILSGALYDPGVEAADMAQAEAELKGVLEGNQRFIKPSEINGRTWKEVLKDLQWRVIVDVTGEQKDVQGAMATLTTVLQTVAGLQGQPMPPEMKLVFDKILQLSATVSPLELSQASTAQPVPQMQPQPIAQPA